MSPILTATPSSLLRYLVAWSAAVFLNQEVCTVARSNSANPKRIAKVKSGIFTIFDNSEDYFVYIRVQTYFGTVKEQFTSHYTWNRIVL